MIVETALEPGEHACWVICSSDEGAVHAHAVFFGRSAENRARALVTLLDDDDGELSAVPGVLLREEKADEGGYVSVLHIANTDDWASAAVALTDHFKLEGQRWR